MTHHRQITRASVLRRASLLLVIAGSCVVCSPVSAGKPFSLQRWGRLIGMGWGDGYHACRDGGFRPGADLPPQGYYEQFGPKQQKQACAACNNIYGSQYGLAVTHSCDEGNCDASCDNGACDNGACDQTNSFPMSQTIQLDSNDMSSGEPTPAAPTPTPAPTESHWDEPEVEEAEETAPMPPAPSLGTEEDEVDAKDTMPSIEPETVDAPTPEEASDVLEDAANEVLPDPVAEENVPSPSDRESGSIDMPTMDFAFPAPKPITSERSQLRPRRIGTRSLNKPTVSIPMPTPPTPVLAPPSALNVPATRKPEIEQPEASTETPVAQVSGKVRFDPTTVKQNPFVSQGNPVERIATTPSDDGWIKQPF